MEDLLQESYERDKISSGVIIEGVTPEFIWYESEQLKQSMSNWQSRLTKIVAVMEARHKEHLKMIDGLLYENKKLKEELNERS